MHMADALLSPAVGGALWAASGATLGYCSKKISAEGDDRKIPLMGVLGAFVFAAQMINFSIPGTGSSGHLGGGLLLAILLGPQAAFLVMASVLTVQALFFADGGLLALGCNIFNMGFLPCFIAYPLIYKKLVRSTTSPGRTTTGAVLGSVTGLALGAFAVVLETIASGISELPFSSFVLAMLPIHLAIGLVEGLITATVVRFIHQAEPDILKAAAGTAPATAPVRKQVLAGLLGAALLTGGLLSWFASTHPDGLEWSIARVTGTEKLTAPTDGVHQRLAAIQEKTALLPDYGFKSAPADQEQEKTGQEGAWPTPETGTTLSGIIGTGLTLALVALAGLFLRRRGFPGEVR